MPRAFYTYLYIVKIYLNCCNRRERISEVFALNISKTTRKNELLVKYIPIHSMSRQMVVGPFTTVDISMRHLFVMNGSVRLTQVINFNIVEIMNCTTIVDVPQFLPFRINFLPFSKFVVVYLSFVSYYSILAYHFLCSLLL